MSHNVARDVKPRTQWLLDLNTRINLIADYFEEFLVNLNGYKVLEGFGWYYARLVELETNIRNIVNVMAMVGQIELRSHHKAQFKLLICEGCTVSVTIHLLRLGKPDYYELYLEEERRFVEPGDFIKGTELVDVVEGLFTYLC